MVQISLEVSQSMQKVGKLEVKYLDDGQVKDVGTAFFIENNKIATAYHVIEKALINEDENIRFNKDFEVIFKLKDYSKDRWLSSKIKYIDLHDKECDLCILDLEEEFSFDSYLNFVDFPLINNNDDEYINKIDFQTYGYAGMVTTAKPFNGTIEGPKDTDNELFLKLNGGIIEELDGLSGAPLLVNGKVYGIITIQAEPDLGLHASAVRTKKFKNILTNKKIQVIEFKNKDCLKKEDYKNKLLDEVVDEINKMRFRNEEMKKNLLRAVEFVTKSMKKWEVIKFESVINSILLPFDKSFILDKNYSKHLNSLKQIIIHTTLLKYAFLEEYTVEFNNDSAKGIKLNNDKYISYIYLDSASYIIAMIELFRYFKEHPEKSMEGISHILVGSTGYDFGTCSSQCKESNKGLEWQFKEIINDISDPFDSAMDTISNIKENFDLLEFHCYNCLKCDVLNSLDESRAKIKTVLGGLI